LHGAGNVFVVETLAYLANSGLFVYNVKDPTAPVPVDSFLDGLNARDVIVVDTLAYVGCYDAMRILSVADPHNMRLVASAGVPRLVWRIAYAPPYVYAACFEGGICIYETTTTGLQEPPGQRSLSHAPFEVRPTLTRGALAVLVAGDHASAGEFRLVDVTGRVAMAAPLAGGRNPVVLDLSELPSGVYWVERTLEGRRYAVKVVRH